MEAAIALGALVVVTALAVGAIAAVGAAIRCTDAARELARLAARGEPERGRAVAAALAPAGARITLTVRGDEATAEVTAAPVRWLPVRVSSRTVAVLEPGAAPWAPSPGTAPPGTAPPGTAPPGTAAPDLDDPGAALPSDPAGGPPRSRSP